MSLFPRTSAQTNMLAALNAHVHLDDEDARPAKRIRVAEAAPRRDRAWLVDLSARIHSTFQLVYQEQTYPLYSIGSGQHSIIYKIDEQRVARVLRSAETKKGGPSWNFFHNMIKQAKALQTEGMSIAAIENDPLVDGFAIQRRVTGGPLKPLANLEGANKAKADVIKGFLEYALQKKVVIDLQMSNFVMDGETPVLVDFYEHDYDEDDVRMEMQKFLITFLPAFCQDPAIGRYITANLETLAPRVREYLKAAEGLGDYVL